MPIKLVHADVSNSFVFQIWAKSVKRFSSYSDWYNSKMAAAAILNFDLNIRLINLFLFASFCWTCRTKFGENRLKIGRVIAFNVIFKMVDADILDFFEHTGLHIQFLWLLLCICDSNLNKIGPTVLEIQSVVLFQNGVGSHLGFQYLLPVLIFLRKACYCLLVFQIRR